jgi:hypothetical protein
MHSNALKPAANQAGWPDAVADSTVLELYLADTRQMFNSMDPAPFRMHDLDPKAAEYVVDWAHEAPKGQPLSLVVHLGQYSATADDAEVLAGAARMSAPGRSQVLVPKRAALRIVP